MPETLRVLGCFPGLEEVTRRLERRYFAPLASAPKVQGRPGEWARLIQRLLGDSGDVLADKGNDWLMRAMRRQCQRRDVTAVHAYEDCSLSQFEEAKRRGKACFYDMPIGYYPAWQQIQQELCRNYSDWLPAVSPSVKSEARIKQKCEELKLADLTLVPSSFVEATIRKFEPLKTIARAPYGVDLDFWRAPPRTESGGPLRFIYAGHMSLRKGTPLLIEAWKQAGLRDAELELVGPWHLAEHQRRRLPDTIKHTPACSREVLRNLYRAADAFVFPSYFEGLGMVLLEALACGLPAIASESTGAVDVLTSACGRIVPTGNTEALVEGLRWFSQDRDRLPMMRLAARRRAEAFTWERYRTCLTEAVASYV